MTTPRPSMTALRLAALGACAAALALAGCRGDRSNEPPREFFPGLDDQPKYKSQAQSDLFSDGRSMRQPPKGVVAFGRRETLGYGSTPEQAEDAALAIALERADLLREDDALYRGMGPDGKPVLEMPVRSVLGAPDGQPVPPDVVERLIERGRDRYNIYCIVCHGGSGKGDGTVGLQWNGVVANLQDPKYQRGGELGQDGHLFDVIRNGVANPPGTLPAYRMPPYGEKIDERDAWAIVAWIRAMQASQSAPFDSVPDSERERLLRARPSAPSASAASETGGTQ